MPNCVPSQDEEVDTASEAEGAEGSPPKCIGGPDQVCTMELL